MPEIVKYERIHTADHGLHAATTDAYDGDDGIEVETNAYARRHQFQAHSQRPLAAMMNSVESQPNGVGVVGTTRNGYNVAQKTVATFALILFYFCLSIGLTFYQRWLLKVRDVLSNRECLFMSWQVINTILSVRFSVLQKFPFPLFVVACHLIIKLVISVVIRFAYRLCTGRSRVLLDWSTFVRKVSPTGLASGIDIGFSNWGLELVTISL